MPSLDISRIVRALGSHRAALQSAFYEALYYSLRPDGLAGGKPGEVATLIRFFANLPSLQDTLNGILMSSGISTSLKGIFCHVSGKTGPVVEFDDPRSGRGCEICDLLILVTYGSGGARQLGNAFFLQAKLRRADLNKGFSTARQRELYEQAPQFRFRNALNYASTILGEPDPAGTRTMPAKDSSAFCYWPFSADHAATTYVLNSSTIIVPRHFARPELDLPFPEALLKLMIGRVGQTVEPAVPGVFGWNRIVHDVVMRAMREALRCRAGIVGVKDLGRVHARDQAEMLAALTSSPAIVSNPFDELSDAFGGGELGGLAMKLSSHSRITEKDLDAILGKGDGGKPPEARRNEEVPDEGDGGAAFLQIHISDQG